MKGIRKRVAVVLVVVVLGLTVQPFHGDTVRAEEERVYCTEYDVCRERQIGELYFDNIKVYCCKISLPDGGIIEESTITCNVTNLSEEEIFEGEQYVEMAFFKDGREIDTLKAGCGWLRPGETHVISYGVIGADLTEADFMAMRIYGKQNDGEIISIDEPEFKKSRVVEKVLILNNFELRKVRQDCWRFRGGATAIKDMYVPWKITFTFTGEDNRTEQYSTEIQLDQSFSTEYEADFGDMSWVKSVEVSYEKGMTETIVLNADDIEEMIPDSVAKFTEFEIWGDNVGGYWAIEPQYSYYDPRYKILQVYYEILDEDENVLVSYSKDINSQYGQLPGLPIIQTDAHMERAVRVRAYITTRPFYPLEDDRGTVEEEEGLKYCVKYGVCRERQIEELYFHNIKLWWDGDQSHLTCDVTNLSENDTALEKDYVTLGFYKDGGEMITMLASHSDIPPGEKRAIDMEVRDINLTEADFMVMGIYGKENSSEIVSIDEKEFKKNRYVGNVLRLNNFELRKVKWDRWTFKGGATAIKDMYVPYKITFTFMGDDGRTEQYCVEIQLDKNVSTEYGADFGDMSWVKNMEVSFEKDAIGTIVLETGDVEEMIPDTAVKFTGFEITETNGKKYWSVKPQFVYEDVSYQILQAYYEILDKDENVLMTYSQDIYNEYGTIPELPAVQTDAHMERAVQARVYFRTRPFYPPEESPKVGATDPPQESPKQNLGSEQMGQSSNVEEQSQDRSMSTSGSLHSSIKEKEEKVGAVSLKISESTTGLPVLALKGKKNPGKYQIYRSQKKGRGYKKIAEISTSKYTDKEVKGGSIYYYKARQVIWEDGKMKPGPFTKSVRTTVQKQDIPQFRIQSRRYSAELSYAEVQLRRYQGDYVQIFYRKPGDEFRSIKLKQNRISKQKVFRISYERKISGIYIKVRTYKVQNGRRQYSDFSKTIKVS